LPETWADAGAAPEAMSATMKAAQVANLIMPVSSLVKRGDT
jgi:hypothetical protein